MKRTTQALVVAVVGLMASWGGSASAFTFTFGPGDYDNTANTVTGTNTSPVYTNNQMTGNFRDVFWWGTTFNGGTAGVGSPDFINSGNNLVLSSNHAQPLGDDTALNFTGIRIPTGGASFLSIYDTTPGDGTATKNLFGATAAGGLTLSADVLFAETAHSSAGGIVTLYNEGQDGLALLAKSAGNTDDARLDLVFSQSGTPTVLTSVSVGSLFQSDTNGSVNTGAGSGDHWYRIIMNVQVVGDAWTVNGSFFNHSDPTNPNSALGTLITTLTFAGSLLNPDGSPCSATPLGNNSCLTLTNPGEIGLMAWTPGPFSDGLATGGTGANPGVDNVGVSITNFNVPTAVPQPPTMFLTGTGLVLLGSAARRRLFRG